MNFTLDLFTVTFMPSEDMYGVSILSVSNDEGANRSLLSIEYCKDMYVIIDILWFKAFDLYGL
jgi:hypothetical protein